MEKVLLFSPSIDGHEMEYGYYLTNYLSRCKKVYLLTSKKWNKSLTYEKETNVEILNILEDPIDIKIKNKLHYFFIILKYIKRAVKILREKDINCFHILYADSYLGVLFFLFLVSSLKKRDNVVITIHRKLDSPKKYVNKIKRIIFPFVYKNVRCIFVHGEIIKSNLLLYTKKGKGDKVNVVPYGTLPSKSVQKNVAEEKLNLKSNNEVKRILFFGTIRKDKGLDILVNSLKELNIAYELLIAGKLTSINESEFYEIIKPIKLKVISHLGYIDEDLVQYYFGASDILVLPYRKTFGGQSGPLTLACSYNVPIVSTNVGAMGQTIIENNIGIVCEAEDPKRLLEALTNALSLTPNNIKQIKNNQSTYANLNTWGNMVGRIVEVYNLLIN